MKFEDLDAWQKARELVKRMYELTKEKAIAKDFAFCNQLQRASVSVMSNITEGFERIHNKEKIQFYNVARASCGEVRSLLYFATELDNGLEPKISQAKNIVEETGKLVSGLIRSRQKYR
jgi:four helix bundle protein